MLENLYLVTVNITKYTYRKLDYCFNGKELDPETGNYYYGARYYDPKISVWLSVDPLAHKYPSFSPYVFTGNNPIMLVDPDGRDIWEIDVNGDVVGYTENKEIDQIIILDGEGNQLAEKTMEFGTIENLGENDDNNRTMIYVDPEASSEVFEFMAESTNVEWGEFKFEEGESKVYSSREEGAIDSEWAFSGSVSDGRVITEWNHSHPNNYPRPSGASDEPMNMARNRGADKPSKAGEWGDVGVAKTFNKELRARGLPIPFYNVYVPGSQRYVTYTENTRD